ncbi:MAG: DsbA family protein [Thermoleophilia bacterium]
MAKRVPKKSAKKRPPKKAARKKQGRNRGIILAVVAGVTLLALVGVIVATVIVSRPSSEPLVITGGSDVTSLLQGIPQQNNVLGDPNAPVTMVEFADMKCPVCGRFSSSALPQIINDYVRTGKLRIVLKLQTFVNNQKTPGDTERGARFALAAGEQNRLWNFAELLYKNQPPEDQRYFTDEFLTNLGHEIAGLDVQRAFSGTDSDAVSKELDDYKQAFSTSGFDAVPSFQIGRTGTTLTNITSKSLDYSVFKSAIDSLL